MEEIIAKLRTRFPTLPKDSLQKIYKSRLERMKVFTRLGFPENIRWIIEAKVRLAGEFSNLSTKHLPGMGKSSFAKKRRAKRLEVCHKCARWNCNTHCRSKGMVSTNREDKIQFIKDGLRKESLDNILQTFDMHPSGDVQRVLLDLVELFQKERNKFEKLPLKDPVCQFVRKLDS